MIKPPASLPDRAIDCESALADEFKILAGRAEAAGWSTDVVVAALLALSLAQVRSRRTTAGGKSRITDARQGRTMS